MGNLFSKPKAVDTTAQDEALAASQARADAEAEKANKELSSAARFAKNRRTGRRLLLAPGRESQVADLGGGSSSSGSGNF